MTGLRVQHRRGAGCGESDVERYEANRREVARCVGCGAEAVGPPPAALMVPGRRFVPGTPEWEEAWRLAPADIAAELTPDEIHDPELNPMHPFATSWPPTRTPAVPATRDAMSMANAERNFYERTQ